MNLLSYLNSLRPAIPYSAEKPVDSDGKCRLISNGELRRHIGSGAVLINGEKCKWDEEIDFPVFSIVFFPKSQLKRTTIV